MVSEGNVEGAAAMFELLYGGVDQSRISAEQFIGLMPAYADALAGVENDTRGAAEATSTLNDAFVKVDPAILQGKAQEVRDANQGILQSFIDLGQDINDTEVSLDDYFTGLEEQIQAQMDFIDNIIFLRGA